MLNPETTMQVLSLLAAGLPLVILLAIGLPAIVERPLSERTTAGITGVAVGLGFLASVALSVTLYFSGRPAMVFELGNWFEIRSEHFHFKWEFLFDSLSLSFLLLSYGLCGVISAFATKYMHRETGYQRFFVLFAIFLLGMVLSSLAATIETLFAGWELVGLSSALLVAFFHERSNPLRNGMRVWTTYRVADASFLMAAILLHHLYGQGEFSRFLGTQAWPLGTTTLTGSASFWIGVLLLIAAAGKSALVPFSGWIPRAMEGPTPSSAIFYGALSVHLGAFLLLRVSPILNASPLLSGMTIAIGLTTAVLAGFSARVQSDVKSALAYASLIQVGLIVAEIGAGLRYFALAHIVGHACLRTLQLLRAPSVLQDRQQLENALGLRLQHGAPSLAEKFPKRWQRLLYRLSWERWHLDAILDEYAARPFLSCFRFLHRCEQRFVNWIDGPSRANDRMAPKSNSVKESE